MCRGTALVIALHPARMQICTGASRLEALISILLLCNVSQVGNFLSDRPSSRVLAPPGGASQVFFG